MSEIRLSIESGEVEVRLRSEEMTPLEMHRSGVRARAPILPLDHCQFLLGMSQP